MKTSHCKKSGDLGINFLKNVCTRDLIQTLYGHEGLPDNSVILLHSNGSVTSFSASWMSGREDIHNAPRGCYKGFFRAFFFLALQFTSCKLARLPSTSPMKERHTSLHGGLIPVKDNCQHTGHWKAAIMHVFTAARFLPPNITPQYKQHPGWPRKISSATDNMLKWAH